MSTPRATVAWAVLLLACAPAPAKRTEAPVRRSPAPAATARPISDELLDNLAILATNRPRDRNAQPAVRNAEELDRYLDALVEDPRFARDVAPALVLHQVLLLAGKNEGGAILSKDESSATPVYYLEPKRCQPREAESVNPWWAMSTVIKVCPSAHRPKVLKSSDTGQHCGESEAPGCGCGPNLAFCFRDDAHAMAFKASLKAEITMTVGDVVARGGRLDEVFISNETIRDRNAEFAYRRWRISSGEPAARVLADLASFPEKPVRAARLEVTPHQHAGVLTTDAALAIDSGARARMKFFYEALWCDDLKSTNVSTQTVLSLKTGDLRSQNGWQTLAALPVCTDCHARLDYGAQFFTGYGQYFAYDPIEHVAGRGKLYNADIKDYRGEAELDPPSFAALAVAQPEFARCIVRDVKRHVFADPFRTDVDGALKQAFEGGHSLKGLMRAALGAYAERERPSAREIASGNEALAGMTRDHCVRCHGESRQPDLRAAVDVPTRKRMLAQVAFGAMPKAPASMPSEERRRFVELLIRESWTDESARRAARAYFEDAPALPVHRLPGILSVVNARAGAAPGAVMRPGLAEAKLRPEDAEYTAGVAAIVAIEAVRACKATGHSGDALAACVDRAARVTGIVRATTPPAPGPLR